MPTERMHSGFRPIVSADLNRPTGWGTRQWLLLAVVLAVLPPVLLWTDPASEGGQTALSDRKEAGDPAKCEDQCGLPESDEELRRLLTPEQYRITRQNGTERPFANAFWNHKEPGIYVDVISGEPLFGSTDKFDSGSGWPSFTRPLRVGAVRARRDDSHGMTRTEVRSAKANSHLGHVFPDGPEPTGLRYCINSAALRFVPVDRLAAEGYGEFLPLFGRPAQAVTAGAGRLQQATFGAGCFWGVEAAFGQLPGVAGTAVGYSGGHTDNPSYDEVCSDETGHAEVVQVEFDPAKVSYRQLVDLFFRIHDPTTLNRQGPDVGTQYRSVIFTHDAGQARIARAALEEWQQSGRFGGKIVTRIEPIKIFYRAEEYHQQYLARRGLSSCRTPE